jgi:hypothetical protein
VEVGKARRRVFRGMFDDDVIGDSYHHERVVLR